MSRPRLASLRPQAAGNSLRRSRRFRHLLDARRSTQRDFQLVSAKNSFQTFVSVDHERLHVHGRCKAVHCQYRELQSITADQNLVSRSFTCFAPPFEVGGCCAAEGNTYRIAVSEGIAICQHFPRSLVEHTYSVIQRALEVLRRNLFQTIQSGGHVHLIGPRSLPSVRQPVEFPDQMLDLVLKSSPGQDNDADHLQHLGAVRKAVAIELDEELIFLQLRKLTRNWGGRDAHGKSNNISVRLLTRAGYP